MCSNVFNSHQLQGFYHHHHHHPPTIWFRMLKSNLEQQMNEWMFQSGGNGGGGYVAGTDNFVVGRCMLETHGDIEVVKVEERSHSLRKSVTSSMNCVTCQTLPSTSLSLSPTPLLIPWSLNCFLSSQVETSPNLSCQPYMARWTLSTLETHMRWF